MKEEALLNAEEDARFGEPLRGDELPEELRRREDRLAAVKERAAQREARARVARSGSVTPRVGNHRGEPEDKAQSNFTDSAKTGGFQHNAQVAGRASVDCCDGADDQRPGSGAARSRRPSTNSPRRCLAGYCNERDLSELEARGIDVAPGREGNRTVNRDPHAHPATLVEKLATPTGRECYAQRKRLRPMAKEIPGFRRFSVRGLDKARGDLVRLARQASANASGNVRGPCSPVKHDRKHRASCTPLACSTRSPRCSGVRPRVQPPPACLEPPFYGASS